MRESESDPSPGGVVSREDRRRVVIVGAGIVGLAHAWSAARRGHRVTVFERDALAGGASIRNFGMIWPIGQPPGELHRVAMRSRALWLMLEKEAGLWVRSCGSIHLAHRDDEWAGLEEFSADAEKLGYECELLNPRQVAEESAAVNPDGLRGGLLSRTELCVNPRSAVPRIAEWLGERFGVRFNFATPIRFAEQGRLHPSEGRAIEADLIVVAAGDDCRILFPDHLRDSGVRRCKLQMLKTAPQPADWSLGPHLAGGLTLRHYANFAGCPSLAEVKSRIARETPELDRFGIHVMASANDQGEIILGDSHEYDEAIEPFDKTLIDALMLRELRRIIRLPNWEIARRWHGIYLKHPHSPIIHCTPSPGVHISTATGGAGMTLSFGLAEQFWEGM